MEKEKYITSEKYQKSANFLLPLTGITSQKFLPKCSYLYWDGDENIDNFNLIVHYNSNQEGYDEWEKQHILILDKLSNCYNVKEGVVYIFNIIEYLDDVLAFMRGKYSRFSKQAKDIILKFVGGYGDDDPRPGRPIHMALYPEKYFYVVAKELFMEPDDLRETGELCQPFNLKDETAHFEMIEECICKR